MASKSVRSGGGGNNSNNIVDAVNDIGSTQPNTNNMTLAQLQSYRIQPDLH